MNKFLNAIKRKFIFKIWIFQLFYMTFWNSLLILEYYMEIFMNFPLLIPTFSFIQWDEFSLAVWFLLCILMMHDDDEKMYI